MDLIVKLAKGHPVTDAALEAELYNICEKVHSCCDSDCPVYRLNGHEIPNTGKTPFGCDCFRSGAAMLDFIRNHPN